MANNMAEQHHQAFQLSDAAVTFALPSLCNHFLLFQLCFLLHKHHQGPVLFKCYSNDLQLAQTCVDTG